MNIRLSFAPAFLLLIPLLLTPVTVSAADAFPMGCVSCHTVDKAKGADHRLSVALKEWTLGKIDAGLLAKAKASAPAGVTLKGKHPSAEDSLEDIPNACLDCPRRGLEEGAAVRPAAAPGALDRREQRIRHELQGRVHALPQARRLDRHVGRMPFDATRLRKGENTISLLSHADSWAQGVLYDYLRLELREP